MNSLMFVRRNYIHLTKETQNLILLEKYEKCCKKLKLHNPKKLKGIVC